MPDASGHEPPPPITADTRIANPNGPVALALSNGDVVPITRKKMHCKRHLAVGYLPFFQLQ
jgi:hypothetical protein